MQITRQTWVLCHRYAGLFMAFFLVVAGVTGTILAFQEELDHWFNPTLFKVEKANKDIPLGRLLEKVEAEFNSQVQVTYVKLDRHADDSMQFYMMPKLNPKTQKPYAVSANMVFVNPYTADILGMRESGAFILDKKHLIPLIYRLHYSLALPSPWGIWFFGAASFVWVFDCFVGFYLTLPRKKKDFIGAWKPAWKIKWSAAFTRINLDIHRAFSLWIWGMLLIFAVSGVMFNLQKEIYLPVLRSFTNYQTIYDTQKMLPKPIENPTLSFEQALEQGRKKMAMWAKKDNFTIYQEGSLSFSPWQNFYQYRVRSSLDLPNSFAQTVLYFDGTKGDNLGQSHPYQDKGHIISAWLGALHMGHLFGTWYQIFISILGVIIAVLSVTGVIVWWKKRQARVKQKVKKSLPVMVQKDFISLQS